MLEHIEIKNFKSIKEKYFPLKNLNVLLGLNGQGKSSFIQSLLLLRQSNDKLNKGLLNLNGEYVKIGNSKDALYQYAKNDLEFNLQFSKGENFDLTFDYKAGLDVFTIKNFIPKKTEIITSNLETEGLFGNNFQYLNADRIEPKSLHTKSLSSVSMNRNIGVRGEFTVHFLEVNGSDSIEFKNCLHPKTVISTNNKNEKIIDKRLIHQVNLWLSEISPEVNREKTFNHNHINPIGLDQK